jgi:6-hydroxycyclohex-1-ene-1-carbonyl-CoA dehydrogenase
MTNTAIRWLMTESTQPLVAQSIDLSAPQAGEVVVRVAGCGVCHTDLGFYYDGVRTKHALPLTLGHEISGHVVATGEGAEAWRGRAVIVPAVIPCGTCETCKRGKYTICPHQLMPGNDIHGGFASHITVPAFGLCAVDEQRLAALGMDLAQVSIVADAVTTPYQAAVQAGIREGDLVIVVGIGGVGGYAAQIARALGAKVVALDVSQQKLDAVADFGAALTINTREHDARATRKAIADFAVSRGLRTSEWIILECSGTAAGQETAYNLLNHGATLCVVGFTMDRVEIRLSNLMAFHARALGNWGCSPELYPGALDLVLSGRVQVAPFIEKHALDDINHVFEAAHAGALARRAILVPMQSVGERS